MIRHKVKGVCYDCGEESDNIMSIPGIRYIGKIDVFFCPECYKQRKNLVKKDEPEI